MSRTSPATAQSNRSPLSPRGLAGTLIVVALPALVLAIIGTTHPTRLNDDSAMHWQTLHIVLLPLFPLLALAPWLVVRRLAPRLGWIAATLGYLYAAFYSALDVLAGIGAGGLQLAGITDGKGVLYDLADALVVPGVIALLVVTVLAAALAVRHAGWRAIAGGLLVVAAAVSFFDSHIYWPRGVLTMLAFAVGWTPIVLATRKATTDLAR